MSSRQVGAVLALTAAVLLAVSIATSALWSGHPSINGHAPVAAKRLDIGVLGATGCRPGGDGSCESVPLTGVFPVVAYVGAGTQILLALVLLVLGVLSLGNRAGRKSLAKVAIAMAVLCAAVVAALFVIGPAFKQGTISVPIGYGLYIFGGAFLGTIIASILAPKDDAPSRPRPSRTPLPPPVPEFNVEALFATDPPPPAGPHGFAPNGPPAYSPHSPHAFDGANGPHAFDGSSGPMVPPGSMHTPHPGAPRTFGPPPPNSPGGMLPGPAGPLGASSAPMFGEQPAVAPLTFPPSFGARPDTSLDPHQPAPPPSPPVSPGMRNKAASIVPPPRANAPSIPPGGRPKPSSMVPPSFVVPSIPPFVAAGSTPGAMLPPLPGLPPIPAGKPPTAIAVPPPEERTNDDAPAFAAPDTAIGITENTDMSAAPVADDDEPMTTRKLPDPPARDSESDLAETRAREKFDPDELEATNDVGNVAAAFHAANASSEPAPPEIDPDALAKIPVTTASETLPPPKEEKSAAAGPQPACPQCDAPMAWVEEHLRFFCKSCRMYF